MASSNAAEPSTPVAPFVAPGSKIKIRSDGLSSGTGVTLVHPDGTEQWLTQVVSVTWTCALADDGEHTLATATVVFDGVDADVSGIGVLP